MSKVPVFNAPMFRRVTRAVVCWPMAGVGEKVMSRTARSAAAGWARPGRDGNNRPTNAARETTTEFLENARRGTVRFMDKSPVAYELANAGLDWEGRIELEYILSDSSRSQVP
jgi:hypothetical protein